MNPGRPEGGRKVFVARGCSSCHRVRGKGKPVKKGPDLRARNLRLSVSEITGVLWNHGTLIWDKESPKTGGKPKPVTASEMADLVAFLYSIAFEGEEGVALTGKRLFEDRGCKACHSSKKLPPIEGWIQLATKLWNHVQKKGKAGATVEEWPRFTPKEMGNLAAFLLHLREERK
jgi:cytochrome c2